MKTILIVVGFGKIATWANFIKKDLLALQILNVSFDSKTLGG